MNIFELTDINNKRENSPRKCGICGEIHFYKDCKYVIITNHVSDRPVISRAWQSLPEVLEIKALADETYSVYARSVISMGTEFGPFVAKKTLTLKPSISFPLKLFMKHDDDFSEYYLDTTEEDECSWMMFVNAASDVDEQNLICFQENENIYFGTVRDINPGEPLKVWYSPYYASKMKKQTLSFKDSAKSEVASETILPEDLTSIIKKQQKIVSREIWNCKFCYKLEKDVLEFAKHLYTHYWFRRRRICPICKKKFQYQKDYLNHIKIVHEDTLGEKTKTNYFSQYASSAKKETNKNNNSDLKDSIGGPLLVHNVLNDSCDNLNLAPRQAELNPFDINNLENHNMLLDSENLNLGIDCILNHNVNELDYLDSEANKIEDKEEYICDICLKTFTSLRGITAHLKLHMGKYFCKTCRKVFGRLENLNQHKCNISFSLKCPKCDKLFFQKKYLNRHMKVVHNKKYSCPKCHKICYSPFHLKNHVCASVSAEKRKRFRCTLCSKMFLNEAYLEKHLKIHSDKDAILEAKIETYICSVCAITFSSKRNYRRHVATVHDGQNFDCHICDKKFNRKDILKRHMIDIHGIGLEEVVKCTTCNKEFKSKKNLHAHMSSHKEIGDCKCQDCGALFKYQTNLVRHRKHCLTTKVADASLLYECSFCHIKVKLKNSLQRHIRKKHSEEYAKQNLSKIDVTTKRRVSKKSNRDLDIDTVKKCMDLQKTIENMDFNLDSCNANIDGLFNESETIDTFLKESSEKIHGLYIESAKEVDIFKDLSSTSLIRKDNKEVCLSMPDLSVDQEIKLGKNAYMLDNGNIVEPQENSSDVVVYVITEKDI